MRRLLVGLVVAGCAFTPEPEKGDPDLSQARVDAGAGGFGGQGGGVGGGGEGGTGAADAQIGADAQLDAQVFDAAPADEGLNDGGCPPADLGLCSDGGLCVDAGFCGDVGPGDVGPPDAAQDGAIRP